MVGGGRRRQLPREEQKPRVVTHVDEDEEEAGGGDGDVAPKKCKPQACESHNEKPNPKTHDFQVRKTKKQCAVAVDAHDDPAKGAHFALRVRHQRDENDG